MSHRMKTEKIILNGCVLERLNHIHRPHQCFECPKYDNPEQTNRLDIDYCLDHVAWLDWMGWTCRKATTEEISESLKPPLDTTPQPKKPKSFSQLRPNDPWTGKVCGCSKLRKDFYDCNASRCKACLNTVNNERMREYRKTHPAPKRPVGMCECGKKFRPYKIGVVLYTHTCRACYSRKVSVGSKKGWAQKRAREALSNR